MTKTAELERMVQDLGDDETCPVCKDKYQIACPDHMTEVDEDGWCLTCDTPDAKPGKVNCPCQG